MPTDSCCASCTPIRPGATARRRSARSSTPMGTRASTCSASPTTSCGPTIPCAARTTARCTCTPAITTPTWRRSRSRPRVPACSTTCSSCRASSSPTTTSIRARGARGGGRARSLRRRRRRHRARACARRAATAPRSSPRTRTRCRPRPARRARRRASRRDWHELAPLVDRWELINRRDVFEWVARAGLPAVATGDAHEPGHVLTWKTVLPCRKDRGSVVRASALLRARVSLRQRVGRHDARRRGGHRRPRGVLTLLHAARAGVTLAPVDERT